MTPRTAWNMTRTLTCSLALAAALALGACGDVVSSTGDYGNLNYALHIDYDAQYDELDDNRLITGYTHHIHAYLTPQGKDQVSRPADIVHHLEPSAGATLEQFTWDADIVPNLYVTVSQPGTYTLVSELDGRLVDQLALHFDTPDAIELVTYVRAPWDDDFDKPWGELPTVGEGAQVMFVPIPVTDTGFRLIGDVATLLEIDPEWAAVPGMNVNGVYEDGYWGLGGAASWYIIEPGAVTFTFVEPVSGAVGQQTFLVDPAAPEGS